MLCFAQTPVEATIHRDIIRNKKKKTYLNWCAHIVETLLAFILGSRNAPFHFVVRRVVCGWSVCIWQRRKKCNRADGAAGKLVNKRKIYLANTFQPQWMRVYTLRWGDAYGCVCVCVGCDVSEVNDCVYTLGKWHGCKSSAVDKGIVKTCFCVWFIYTKCGHRMKLLREMLMILSGFIQEVSKQIYKCYICI